MIAFYSVQEDRSLLLMIAAQEMLQLSGCLFEDFQSRQVDNPEVIRRRPVESGALYDQDMLLLEQVIGKLHIIMDAEALRVQFREAVKSRFRLDDGNAGDLSQGLDDEVPLLRHASVGQT